MKWKTAITNVNDGKEIIRGQSQEKLALEKSFTEVIWLVLKGELPSAKETKMMNAMVAMMIDHGPGSASALVTRITASTNTSLYSSVAAGVLALGGSRHGGALGAAAKFFVEHIDEKDLATLLASFKKRKIYISGYGHKVLKVDNRAEALLKIAEENGFFGKYCKFALKIKEELNKTSSKQLPLNMDGANAAILLDMGFDQNLIDGFFIIARTPGLVAQAFEEMNSGEGLRRADESDIEYIGK
ncbi:MAG: citryl-CoA lyase [Patescibacteria group bacterium]|jgi:citryl-CoA lyase